MVGTASFMTSLLFSVGQEILVSEARNTHNYLVLVVYRQPSILSTALGIHGGLWTDLLCLAQD